MIPIIIRHLTPGLIAHVAEPAIRSLLLASLAGLALAVVRPQSVSARLAIWTTILYAALAMPFLGWLLPAVPLRLPAAYTLNPRMTLVPARSRAVASSPESWMAANPHPRPLSRLRETGDPPRRVDEGREASRGNQPAITSQSESTAPNTRAVQSKQPAGAQTFWPVIFTAVYLWVAAILFGRFGIGVLLSRRLRRASILIEDPRAGALLDQHGRILRMTRLPLLLESTAVAVPSTLGLHRPAIILPSGWRQWEEAKLGAVLAHELSHVKRYDARTQALSVIHHCIFWFSPFAWWLDWKLAELAEEASDEAALRAGAERTYYAEVVLGFFAILETVGRRVRRQAISMAQGPRAERRLDQILQANVKLSASLRRPALLLLFVCAVPVVCFIATVRPSMMRAQAASPGSGAILPEPSKRATAAPTPGQGMTPSPAAANQATPPAPAAPNPQFGTTVFPNRTAREIPPTPSADPQPASVPPPAPALLGALPALPAPPPAPEPPTTVQSASPSSDSQNNAWFFNGNTGPDYAIVSGNSFFMSGSGGERDEVKALRSKIKRDFIWFRRDAKSYIIQDPSTVREAVEFFAPEQQLGREQADLGQQQAGLGEQQAAMGKQMKAVRIQMPNDLVAQLEEVEAKIKELGPKTNQQELGSLEGQLGRLQGEIGRLQAEAGAQDGAIGREMGELGRKQGELGREQGRLGREQGRLARQANREMGRLIDTALARGLAKPAP